MAATETTGSTSDAELLDFAKDVARAAGAVLLDHFEGEGLEVRTKSSAIDLVTSADRAAEDVVLARVTERFPEHGVLAEESGQAREGELQWIIDPLDGTTNFAHGFPHFAVSIALHDPDGSRIGVVHDPVRAETFSAARGAGAWIESPRTALRRLTVSACERLDNAVIATGFAYRRAAAPDANLAEFTRIVPLLRGIRRAGSAALDLAYVAAGRLDGFWEYNLAPWDTAAGSLLVREAGGRVVAISADQIAGDDARPRADTDAWTPWSPGIACAGAPLLPRLLDALRP